MDISEAKKILGDRAKWELKSMKRYLEMLGGFFNSEEENERLEAVNVILSEK